MANPAPASPLMLPTLATGCKLLDLLSDSSTGREGTALLWGSWRRDVYTPQGAGQRAEHWDMVPGGCPALMGMDRKCSQLVMPMQGSVVRWTEAGSAHRWAIG